MMKCLHYDNFAYELIRHHIFKRQDSILIFFSTEQIPKDSVPPILCYSVPYGGSLPFCQFYTVFIIEVLCKY